MILVNTCKSLNIVYMDISLGLAQAAIAEVTSQAEDSANGRSSYSLNI